jgi:DNA polymerase-3 subunit delta'
MMAFRDVIGNQRAVQIIKKEIERGRVYSAYLFTGMEGVGKKLVALNMAKALNCTNAEGDACDSCPPCQRIDKGVHPDLLQINPTGETIKIGQIRELQQSLAFKPYEARWRVVIVDGAERMTRETANAFLKTLEEPPQSTTIILIAAALEGLPPTVLSRCQRITFNPLSEEEVNKVLADQLTPEEIRARVPLAGGSPGRALRMDSEKVTQARDALPSALSPSLGQRLQLAQELARQEGSGGMFLEILGGWLRDLVVYRETEEEGRLLNRDLADEIKKAASQQKTEGLLRDFWSILHIQQGIEAHGNLRLSLETALVGIGGS